MLKLTRPIKAVISYLPRQIHRVKREGFGMWCGEELERASAFLRRRLTFGWCIAVAVLVYAIVWWTAVYRLHEPSMRAKYLVAATMISRQVPTTQGAPTTALASTQPVDTAATHLQAIRSRLMAPPTTQVELKFFPTSNAFASTLEANMTRAADDLAKIDENSHAFLPAIISYNLAAARLSDYAPETKPFYARWTGEHWYNGCGIGLPLHGRGGVRASARLYLQYADAFAGVWPLPAVDGAKIGPKWAYTNAYPPEQIRDSYASMGRAIEPGIVATPWTLVRFRDPLFAELCANIPKSVFFLLVSLVFMLELRYVSVGTKGLFAEKKQISTWWAVRIVVLATTLLVVILFVEGRATWIEVLRLPVLGLAILTVTILLANLATIDETPLSEELKALDGAPRYRRLFPFALGAAAMCAGAVWVIYYSVFGLLTQFDTGPVLRAALQIFAMVLILRFLIRTAHRLLTERADAPEAAVFDAPTSGSDLYFRELAKALMLILPPFAAAIVEKTLGSL